jgi:hypothetical protein
MKKIVKNTLVIVTLLTILSCGTTKYLPVSVSQRQSFDKYKYVYVDVINSRGSYSYHGCEVLAGLLMKKGFVVLNYSQYLNMSYSTAQNTMKVSYGAGGKRSVGFTGGFTREVTLQFVSATTSDIICICTAEGMGSSELDDVEVAVTRCIQKLFP